MSREDDRARAVFDNLERIPYGPLDAEFTLLRVEDTVVLGSTSCKYPADYRGVLHGRVESEMPGTQCMFATNLMLPVYFRT